MSETQTTGLEPRLEAFARKAVQRERVFMVVTWIGVAVGLSLAVWYATGASETAGTIEWMVVILVLLNARQNLRQVKYASALGALMGTRQS